MNGIVREEYKERLIKLLTSLSGASPFPIEIHEIALEQRGKPDVVVHRYRVQGNEVYESGTRWASSHHSKPPWGDKLLDSLSASIRLVKEAKVPPVKGGRACGPIELWEREGYSVRYHLVKDAVTCDVKTPDGVRLHVLLYRLFKGVRPRQATESHEMHGDESIKSGEEPGVVERGEPHEPVSASVIEVWTQINDPGEGHERSLGGIAWMNGVLNKFGVALHPLREKRKVLQQQRNQMTR